MKLITVVGARPQFIKAATLSRAIASHNAHAAGEPIDEKIVHTGQHYDANMSDVFFRQLDIPDPAWHLGIGSGSHGDQTGRMLTAIEKVIAEERPDLVLVYGDTNSTLAGALAAAKLHLPVAHVEAGLRSFNRRMPEEVNRVMSDHLAELLFCPTEQAVENLAREGITRGVHRIGDVMFDSVRHYRARIECEPRATAALGLPRKGFVLATVHRAENTDSPSNLRGIFAAFDAIQERFPVVVALHPRTRRLLAAHGIRPADGVRLLEPLGYFEMIELEVNARLILTDSGGVQKEAFFAGTPCLTLREETEWVETTQRGANRLCGASTARILEGFRLHEEGAAAADFSGAPYGDGDAAGRILAELVRFGASAGR
jgi:UDP-GlcNAc3NAcA epimerase